MTRLYLNILRAASILDGVSLEELVARYPEGDYFAIRCHGEGLICAPPQEDTEEKTVTMTPVVTVPEVYLGLAAAQVQALRERINLESKIDDLRRTLKGKREFHIPLQEAAVADRRKKLAESEANLRRLRTGAYEEEQEMFRLEIQLNELKREEL